jgi:hypothetical protein
MKGLNTGGCNPKMRTGTASNAAPTMGNLSRTPSDGYVIVEMADHILSKTAKRRVSADRVRAKRAQCEPFRREW